MKNLRNIKFHTSASRRSLIQTGMATLYTIVSFFIVCISNSLTDVVNTNTYKRQEDREVLPDPLMQTFHHYIIEPMGASRLSGPALGNPQVDYWVGLIPDLFIVSSMLLWILALVWPWSFKKSCDILRRCLWVTGTAYLLRAASILLTVLPFSYTSCAVKREPNLLLDALHIFAMQRRSCGDMFFSGHTIIFAISFLTVITYPVHWVATLLSYVQLIVAALFLVGTGYHYTIDVLVSLMIVSALWWSYHLALYLAPVVTKPKTIEWEQEQEKDLEQSSPSQSTDSVATAEIIPQTTTTTTTKGEVCIEVHAEDQLMLKNEKSDVLSLYQLKRLKENGLASLFIRLILFLDGRNAPAERR